MVSSRMRSSNKFTRDLRFYRVTLTDAVPGLASMAKWHRAPLIRGSPWIVTRYWYGGEQCPTRMNGTPGPAGNGVPLERDHKNAQQQPTTTRHGTRPRGRKIPGCAKGNTGRDPTTPKCFPVHTAGPRPEDATGVLPMGKTRLRGGHATTGKSASGARKTSGRCPLSGARCSTRSPRLTRSGSTRKSQRGRNGGRPGSLPGSLLSLVRRGTGRKNEIPLDFRFYR